MVKDFHTMTLNNRELCGKANQMKHYIETNDQSNPVLFLCCAIFAMQILLLLVIQHLICSNFYRINLTFPEFKQFSRKIQWYWSGWQWFGGVCILTIYDLDAPRFITNFIAKILTKFDKFLVSHWNCELNPTCSDKGLNSNQSSLIWLDISWNLSCEKVKPQFKYNSTEREHLLIN